MHNKQTGGLMIKCTKEGWNIIMDRIKDYRKLRCFIEIFSVILWTLWGIMIVFCASKIFVDIIFEGYLFR